jgi:hypothetical protein
MRSLACPAVLLLGLAVVSPTRADFVLQTPVAGVQVNPGGVIINTPWIGFRIPRATPCCAPARTVPALGVPGQPLAPPPAPVPGITGTQPPVVSQFVPVQPAPQSNVPPPPVNDPLPQAPATPQTLPTPVPQQISAPVPQQVPGYTVPTLATFASTFPPTPGLHEVVLLHPFTNQPVKVNFALPPGPPRKVHVNRRSVEFDYGKHYVRLVFFRSGDVQVQQK